jgi:hypothetical protein
LSRWCHEENKTGFWGIWKVFWILVLWIFRFYSKWVKTFFFFNERGASVSLDGQLSSSNTHGGVKRESMLV